VNLKRVETRSSFDRLALLGVTALGMALCSAGVGKVAAASAWLDPAGIAGSVLGAVALSVVGARLLGKPLPLVGVRSDRAAVVLVVAIAAVKVGVAAAFLG
jgi:hypothetical protein